MAAIDVGAAGAKPPGMARMFRTCTLALALGLLLAACDGAGGDDIAEVDAGTIDAALDRPNRAFVTRATRRGDFQSIFAADAVCQSEAAAAGLDGTFLAWLSTSGTAARDRFATSRGWVRTDGVPAFDTIDALIATNRMYNPIDRDPHGVQVDLITTWSGTGPDGHLDPDYNCSNWTALSGSVTAGEPSGSMPDFTAGYNWFCNAQLPFMCLETGHSVEVGPGATADPDARIAFVSRGVRTQPGMAPLDAFCADEAAAAGLPGTYLAAVATSTASVASRFTTDGRAIRRIDGTKVAGPEFFTDVERYDSFVNQFADGTYTAALVISSGASPATPGANDCSGWTDVTENFSGTRAGSPGNSARTDFWSHYPIAPCNAHIAVLCVQE